MIFLTAAVQILTECKTQKSEAENIENLDLH